MTNSRTTEHRPADDPHGKRLSRRLAPLAALVTGLGSAAVALAPAASAATGSATYVSTGAEQTFVVPDGVGSIHVVAVGGRGGSDGGFGATTSADLDVTGIHALYIEVGGNGQNGSSGAAAAGGFNGGGNSPLDGGGGGGASDLRTIPSTASETLASRLLVAGGGGGSGAGNLGGSSGQMGAPGAGIGSGCPTGDSGGGGGGGSQTAGGSGGITVSYGTSPRDDGIVGGPGSGGAGGRNPTYPSWGGGGGGAGYFGGGGGGWGVGCGGGGGGGSSFVDPATGHAALFGTDSSGTPRITISYVVQRPQATTTPADFIGQTTAFLNGVLNPEGLATSFHFDYGTDTGYGSRTDEAPVGSDAEQQYVSADILGLAPDTTYHYRLVATNAGGTTNGEDRSFTTASGPAAAIAPQATTSAAGRVRQHGARLNGVVNPEGTSTTYYFEYGRTSGYGIPTSVQAAGAGAAGRAVHAALSGLPRHTVFHFRLVAVSASGTTYGQDRMFRTT